MKRAFINFFFEYLNEYKGIGAIAEAKGITFNQAMRAMELGQKLYLQSINRKS